MADPFIHDPVVLGAAESPLAGHRHHGDRGNLEAGPGITITERFGVAICELATWHGDRSAAAKAAKATQRVTGLGLKEASDNVGLSAQRFLFAPTRWTLISDDPDMPMTLTEAVGENGTVTNLTHGRTIIRISGPKVRWVLGKLFAVDLADSAFPIGKGTGTVHHTMLIQIQRVADDTFDIIVFRSLARAFWHALTTAAEEVGYRVE